MQVGTRRIEHPGKDRHIAHRLPRLGGQRLARVLIPKHQIAVKGLTRKRQFLQPLCIQARQGLRSLGHQFLESRTPPAFS